ncbi:MAG: DUF1015 domain-containing protein [Clostridia bacterium]|nr:DUF1015 domain-containing protein [Clostridia bacterium]
MKLINKKLGNVGIKVPDILFPKNNVDLSKWAVIACDQYTSSNEYWTEVAKKVGYSPSTLKLMLPEIYLESPDASKRLRKIASEMKKYLRYGVLSPLGEGFMYVERVTSYGHIRKGLLVCIDLEHYNFSPSSASLIRPTEKTIVERIPARVKIRENAVVELPHVMLLIDDPQKSVVEPFASMKNSYKKLYNFDLMQNGGHIEGYQINNIQDMEHISKSLHELADKKSFKAKYKTDKELLLFAVGDGNHSLAAAKTHWENIKQSLTNEETLSHPSRYAMVEIVNIHDDNLKFEPIHRVLFHTEIDDFTQFLKEQNIECIGMDSIEKLNEKVLANAFNKEKHCFGLIGNGKFLYVEVSETTSFTACGTIQCIIDQYMEKNKVEIDFIHDLDSLIDISDKVNCGFLMPPIDKTSFFKTVIEEGTLPRKTFSMGHADEKRFYLETRKITS